MAWQQVDWLRAAAELEQGLLHAWTASQQAYEIKTAAELGACGRVQMQVRQRWSLVARTAACACGIPGSSAHQYRPLSQAVVKRQVACAVAGLQATLHLIVACDVAVAAGHVHRLAVKKTRLLAKIGQKTARSTAEADSACVVTPSRCLL